MKTYKLFRQKNGKLYPLFVESNREMKIGVELKANVGEALDETHVKSRLGPLSLRPGFHSTTIPFTDWIGKRENGELVQRKDTVWCECEVPGEYVEVTEKYGSRELVKGYYKFKTNAKQKDPWIISDRITINKVLSNDEVARICRSNGIEPQRLAS